MDTAENISWLQSSACRGMDPNIFFPKRGGDTKTAKAICNRCPVREACLKHALSFWEEKGVWGGLSAIERRTIIMAKKRSISQ